MKKHIDLQLNDFEVLDEYVQDGIQIYEVQPKEMPFNICRLCNSPNAVRAGIYTRKVRDLPGYSDKPVALVIKTHRLHCPDCGRTATPFFSSVDVKSKMTKRLRHKIEEESLKHSYGDVAERYSVAESTVHEISRRYVSESMDSWREFLYVPEKTALIEVRLLGKNRLIVGDIKRKGIVYILDDSSPETLTAYLETAESIGDTYEFYIGFNSGYAGVIGDVYSRAQVYIDRSYVEQALALAMVKDLGSVGDKTIRNPILKPYDDLPDDQKTLLDAYLATDPQRKAFHNVKELLRTIYRCSSADQAISVISKAQEANVRSNRHLTDLLRNINSFLDEVAGYVEAGTNTSCIPRMKRMVESVPAPSALDFEVLRARILLADDKKKKTVTAKRSDITFDFVFDPAHIPEYADCEVVIGNYLALDVE